MVRCERIEMVVVVVLACLVAGATAQTPPVELQRTARALFEPLPAVAGSPANPVTDAQVALGKMLFTEPRLSGSGVLSCASCHVLGRYGTDGLPTAIGDHWQHAIRNTLSVFNVGTQSVLFWDGRASTLEEQVEGHLLNPLQMAAPDEAFVVDRIASIPGYAPLFRAAFPEAADAVTYANIAEAISAFERTLSTPSRFDSYLRGDLTALSETESEGLQAFIRNGCAGCHRGPALGGERLARFGIVEGYWEATRQFVSSATPTMTMDVGRYAVTHEPGDLYQFKVPALRNVTQTYPYFHDGSVWNLRDAIQVMARVQLDKELPESDVDHLLEFLATLEGHIPEAALQLPVLPPSVNAPRGETR